MSPETLGYINLAGIAAAALFIWRVMARMEDRLDKRIGRLEDHVTDLRERMARLEGAVDLLTKFLIDRERTAAAE